MDNAHWLKLCGTRTSRADVSAKTPANGKVDDFSEGFCKGSVIIEDKEGVDIQKQVRNC